ncbi:MAG TPA: histidinol dehydrogenase, partial [Woeseiaceae bacterium]|nr:histidinol dehydrogenase [Woeseiaceae bacterium]
MQISVTHWNCLTIAQQAALLARPALRESDDLRAGVRRIIERVRTEGDAAIRDLTERFDGVRLDVLRVSERELAAAETALSKAASEAIDVAIVNARRFHEAQMPDDYAVETCPGVRCERRSHPIDAVGLYVPAGSAPLPSTAIMLALPAAIAGCPRRVLCTPPRG